MVKRFKMYGMFFVLALLLTACGATTGGDDGVSGGGDGGVSGGGGVGEFHDSVVQGLFYSPSAGSDTTGADGDFSYTSGVPVEFFLYDGGPKIGEITISGTGGTAYVTPYNIVAGAVDPGDTEVVNIVQLLLMLDDDDNPNNGILITSETAQAVADWLAESEETELDPSSEYFSDDLDDLADWLGTGVPDADDAKAHLANTVFCVNSGGYEGTFAGAATGSWGAIADIDGNIFGVVSHEGEDMPALGEMSLTGSLSMDVEGLVGGSVKFTGSLTPTGNFSGNWLNDDDDAVNGIFTGGRIPLDQPTGRVFKGTFVVGSGSIIDDIGVFTFGVNEDNLAVSGTGSSYQDGDFNISGTWPDDITFGTDPERDINIGLLGENGTIYGGLQDLNSDLSACSLTGPGSLEFTNY